MAATSRTPGRQARSRPGHGDPPYRDLLCLMAAGASVTTMIELALIGHWHGGTQVMAWLAAHAGLSAAWAATRPTGPRLLLAARLLATATVAVASIGVAVHFTTNLAFETELHPDQGVVTRFFGAARGGLPLLAPMALSLPALLVAVATWRHPDGQRQRPGGPETGSPEWARALIHQRLPPLPIEVTTTDEQDDPDIASFTFVSPSPEDGFTRGGS